MPSPRVVPSMMVPSAGAWVMVIIGWHPQGRNGCRLPRSVALFCQAKWHRAPGAQRADQHRCMTGTRQGVLTFEISAI